MHIDIDMLGVPAFSVAVAADGRLIYDNVNAANTALTGLTKARLIGNTPTVFAAPEAARTIAAHYRRCIESLQSVEYEIELDLIPERRWWRTSLFPVIDRAGNVVQIIGLIVNISEQKRAEQDLRSAALKDPLTSVGNRRRFECEIEDAVACANDTARPFSLIVADVDRFKDVNDRYGHPVGDEVLREVARRFGEGVRDGDKVARIGGDEFVAIVPAASKGAVTVVLDRLHRCFAAPIRIGAVEHRIGVSLGAALWSPGMAVSGLMAAADARMYRAKAFGRGAVETADDAADGRPKADPGLLRDVRAALKQKQFVPFFQPIVDLRTGQVRGLEALARWHHPERGILPPSEFAAALADPALSVAIDDAILSQALEQMRRWVDDGVPVAAVNVNASEAQLHRPDLVQRIADLLERNRLPADRLKIELVETAFLGRNPKQIAATVDGLARLGVVTALDDFGTGYASLTHLRQFKIDRVKIDRSFVAGICTDPFDRGLVKSLVDLGKNLGIRMTAEGVETVEQLALLREFGCDCAQGYLIGRPAPADAVPAMIMRWYGSQHMSDKTRAPPHRRARR